MIFTDPLSPAAVADDCLIGLGTAIALGALTAGGQVAGSAIAAHGSKSAAKTQVKASNEARAYEREMYERGRADLQPWMDMGGGARAKLADMLHLPAQSAPTAQPAPTGGGVPMASFAGSGQTELARIAGARRAAPAGGGTQMVMLKAPNGQTKSVPANQVQHFLAQGAQVVR